MSATTSQTIQTPHRNEGYRIEVARMCHMDGMAACHVACFPEQFMSHMGLPFVRAFYGEYVRRSDCIAYVGVDKQTGQVVGLVVGGRMGIRDDFLRRSWKKFIPRLLWKLLSDPIVRPAICRHIVAKIKRTPSDLDTERHEWPQPAGHPWSVLRVIGLLPSFRGSGLARDLTEIFYEDCRQRGKVHMDLAVHTDNARAIAFYNKTGFKTVKVAGAITYMRRPIEAHSPAQAVLPVPKTALRSRILLICYVYPPEVAPAGIMVRELAEGLANAGHDVTVLTGWPNHPKGKLFPGYTMRWRSVSWDGQHRLMRVEHAIGSKESPLKRLWVYFTFAISSLLNGLTLGKQDMVVSLSTPLFGVWTAWMLTWVWNCRFINVVFDVWPEAIHNAGLMKKNIIYRTALRIDTINTRMSDTIITLGENIRQQILLRGVAPERVQIFPFWIDTQRIRPLDSDNSWRRRQGIAPEQFVAIFAGTIGYASGAQMLVHTAEKLADRPDILLLIVGEGPVKNELEVLANQGNLTNMRFLPFQPEEYLAEMQSTADVGLVTLLPKSSFTSVPSKVLGYMAAGRAVVASVPAHSDTAQLINTAGCGIVVEAQDPQAMAQAIATLADDRQRCQNLGSRARSYTVEHLSRQVAVKQFQKVIMES